MLSGLLFVAGLVLAVAGATRLRQKPGRDDEQRWRGFLALLAGLFLLLCAYGSAVGG